MLDDGRVSDAVDEDDERSGTNGVPVGNTDATPSGSATTS